ncbi:MAG: sporulation initiation factor Spo0A C-terminal domain-containing protein [Clostridiales bacterium]|nr:sporulation initiation factor Spo0A C-terminal domain-containing protein [Clostridiales bacterium]
MNRNLYNHAVKLVSDCAIPPHLSGFTFLLEAVVMKSENYAIKLIDIYKSIAQNHHCTPRAITRSIAYAISQSEHIREYLAVGKNDLFNGKVIAMLALKLNQYAQIPEELNC